MKKRKCRQCENPLLKGIHTCGIDRVQKKKKRQTLVTRLREPIGAHQYSDKIGLIITTGNKLDAIGEALAYLVEKKWAKDTGKRVAKQIKRRRS